MNLPPQTMRAIILKEINGPLHLEEVPIPKPLPGQVLIKMEASPIHPADFSFIKGQYGMTKQFPVIPGTEGCGVVIESGGGLLGWKLKGQKVAVASSPSSTGTWAEYMVADSSKCFPLDHNISFEEGAFAIGNPMTALGFYDVAHNREKARAVIFSAACSAVARMSSRYFQSKGIPVINIVRKKEQEEMLKSEGNKYVLNSNEESFEENLKELIKKLKPTCFFDSVGGNLTGVVLKAMPNKSVCYIYGFLAKEKCEVDGRDLRYKEKSIKGFWLSQWIKEKGFKLLFMMNELKSNLKNCLKTAVSKVISMEEIDEGIKYYKGQMSAGKVLIKFSKKKEIEKKEENKIIEKSEETMKIEKNILSEQKEKIMKKKKKKRRKLRKSKKQRKKLKKRWRKLKRKMSHLRKKKR